MDVYLAKFDVFRRKAEKRKVTGSGFPDEFVSIETRKIPGAGESSKYAAVSGDGKSNAPIVRAARQRSTAKCIIGC